MAAFFGAMLLALIICLIFSLTFERDSVGAFIWLFVLIALPLWFAALWMEPVGPVLWGVAWFQLLLIAIIITLLIAAAAPLGYYNRLRAGDPEYKLDSDEDLRRGATDFFWIFVVLMLLLILAGYVIQRPPPTVY